MVNEAAITEAERRADSLSEVNLGSGSSIPSLTATSWGLAMNIVRPVSGWIEVISRDAWIVARYTQNGVGGAKHVQYVSAGPSSSGLIPVLAGTVAIEMRSNPETTIAFDPDFGFNVAGAQTSTATIKWSRNKPGNNGLTINTAPGTAWLLGPALLAPVGGSNAAYVRPPRLLRKLVLSVDRPVTLHRDVGELGGLNIPIGTISTRWTGIVSPWETIVLTNYSPAGGASVNVSASWSPAEER